MEIGGILGDPAFNNKTNYDLGSSTPGKISEDSFERRLQAAMDNGDKEKLRQVCRQFEGILLNMMYRQMKASVPKSELLPASAGREVFESMLDEKLMEEAAGSGSLGLGEILYEQLMERARNIYTLKNEGE